MADPYSFTLIGDPKKEKISPGLLSEVKKRLASGIHGGIGESWLAEHEACELRFDMKDVKMLRINIKMLLEGKPFDWSLLPVEGRKKRLLVSDMDSTMIGQECIDELADFAGLKTEVAKITERAMNGELDFAEALQTRVGLLKDLPATVLEKTFSERIRATPGARELVMTMRANGAHTMLVSGGFTYFTMRVAEMLGFEEQEANRLEIVDEKLTGRVLLPILDKESKLDALRTKAESLWLQPSETLAIGDGANDLPMIKAAGLGIAFRAKELVRREASVAINHTGLTTALYMQGYRKEQFVV